MSAKQPRPAWQVRLSTKQLVWAIREREHNCCGQKVAYFLDKEHQISLSVPKIYEVLAEKYTLRSKWAKNQKRGKVPQAEAARKVIQMDTVHFGQVFAFTAVDIFSHEADQRRPPGDDSRRQFRRPETHRSAAGARPVALERPRRFPGQLQHGCCLPRDRAGQDRNAAPLA